MASQSDESQAKPSGKAGEQPECFVIMPLSDPDGYSPSHFQHVFEDIFRPACASAGYRAIRADQVRETNLIHLDVLQRLLKTPMVLADLSSRNPNVLFELGLRQAFDMPAVLVQEVGTPKIFDIAPLRYTQYRRERIYHEVLEDQKAIAENIRATSEAYAKGTGVNSIVRILALTQPASLPDLQEAGRDPVLQLIRAELNELRLEIRRSQRQTFPFSAEASSTIGDEIARLRSQLGPVSPSLENFLRRKVSEALEAGRLELKKDVSPDLSEKPLIYIEVQGDYKELKNGMPILFAYDGANFIDEFARMAQLDVAEFGRGWLLKDEATGHVLTTEEGRNPVLYFQAREPRMILEIPRVEDGTANQADRADGNRKQRGSRRSSA